MKLQVVEDNAKYWVIRPGSDAKFFRHFKQNGVVALGHIDHVFNQEGVIESVDPVDVYALLKTSLDDRKKALSEENGENVEQQSDEELRKEASQITSSVTQVKTFINELKVGDVVITLNSKNVLIGTINSEAYIENDDLKATRFDGNGYLEQDLSYKLRRKVEWERPRLRDSIPKPIRPNFSPSQTIFSISDKNTELFTHWLYGTFLKGERLYFSTKIDQREKISQFNLTEFQRSIQKLELLAKKIADEELEFGDDMLAQIEEQYILCGMHNEFTLATKNSFLSPGNIWSDVGGNLKELAIFAILVGSLFGVNVEAAEGVDLTNDQQAAITRTVQEMRATGAGKGNFDLFKQELKASLDKPNKSLKEVEIDALEDKEVIVFPKVKKEGDTGV